MAVRKLHKLIHSRGKAKGIKKMAKDKKPKAQTSKAGQKQVAKSKCEIITQEIKFARSLAHKDVKVRNKVLKNLKKWLVVRSKSAFAFTESDFMRLWKGLYYCMWMSDKPLVQEELAESLSQIVHCFESLETAFLFTECALRTLATEWFGIDQYRIDKFQMLARRILRQTLELCKKHNWDPDVVTRVSDIIQQRLIDHQSAFGFCIHITDVYMEEVAKVSKGEISTSTTTELVRPFAAYLAQLSDERLIRHIMKSVFRYLMTQSDVGVEYAEKFEAWKQAGFPSGNLDDMQKVDDSDAEGDESDAEESLDAEQPETSEPLDPRAGHVDVILHQVPIDAKQLVELLVKYKNIPSTTTKSRRQIRRLLSEFEELASGSMPLGVKEIKIPPKKSDETNPKLAALRLLEFEEELYSDTVKNQKKKKRKTDEEPGTSTQVSPAKKKKGKEKLPKKEKNKNINKAINLLLSNNEKKQQKVAKKVEHLVESDLRVKRKLKGSCLRERRSLDNLATVEDKVVKNPLFFAAKSKQRRHTLGTWEVSDNPIVSPQSASNSTLTTEKTVRSNSTSCTNSPITRQTTNNVKRSETLARPSVRRKVVEALVPSPKALATPEKKRVKIMLQRNTMQHTSEYFQQLRMSPGIPYDANRKPLIGVLKPSPLPSPINPFYVKKERKCTS